MPDRTASIAVPDWDRTTAAQRRKILAFLEQRNLFDDLTGKQCRQLTDMVLRFSAAARLFREFGKRTPQQGSISAERVVEADVRADQKHGNSQRRMFKSKIRQAIDAVDDALSYATDETKTRVFARTLKGAAIPSLRAAREALADIPLEEWENFRRPHESRASNFKDPRSETTHALVTFFTNECRLPKGDANHRTAEILAGLPWRTGGTEGTEPNAAALRRATEAVRKRHARRDRRR